jgi:hypothetical protein
MDAAALILWTYSCLLLLPHTLSLMRPILHVPAYACPHTPPLPEAYPCLQCNTHAAVPVCSQVLR